MSMSTHVIGFAPPDEKWKAMKSVYDSCINAGIYIPAEVENFFNGEKPDPAGVSTNIGFLASKWTDGDMCSGIEIDLSKLPKNVKIIRFYNSY